MKFSARRFSSCGDIRIMRITGISSHAARRYAPSVASSAAMVSLSTRSARNSGCRRTRAIKSFSPAMMPACGPPSSLSPLKVTMPTPASMLWRTVGSVIPCSAKSTKQPEPKSSTSGMLTRRLSATSSSREGLSVKPVTLKFEGCTRNSNRVFSLMEFS